MPSYFISGANRGIGLALTETLLTQPDSVVITGVRNPSSAKVLLDLKAKHEGRLEIVPFDLGDVTKIEKAAELTSAFLPNGLDYLINNAAASHQPVTLFADIDFELFLGELSSNVVAPLQVVRAFLPLIRKGQDKKIVYLGSNLGSVELAANFGELSNAYAVTKAALNMAARKWGTTLKAEGITSVILHPGWVETDMGLTIEKWISSKSSLKPISVTESAEGVFKVITDAKLEETTVFSNYDGTRIPW